MAAARPGKVRIDLLVFDVDGVLTDGTMLMDAEGHEWKQLRYRDLDAVTAATAAGLKVAFLSGETGPLLARIAERFGIQLFSSGAKDKGRGLTALAHDAGVPMSRVCYVGDSDRDAPALALAGLGSRRATPRHSRERPPTACCELLVEKVSRSKSSKGSRVGDAYESKARPPARRSCGPAAIVDSVRQHGSSGFCAQRRGVLSGDCIVCDEPDGVRDLCGDVAAAGCVLAAGGLDRSTLVRTHRGRDGLHRCGRKNASTAPAALLAHPGIGEHSCDCSRCACVPGTRNQGFPPGKPCSYRGLGRVRIRPSRPGPPSPMYPRQGRRLHLAGRQVQYLPLCLRRISERRVPRCLIGTCDARPCRIHVVSQYRRNVRGYRECAGGDIFQP